MVVVRPLVVVVLASVVVVTSAEVVAPAVVAAPPEGTLAAWPLDWLEGTSASCPPWPGSALASPPWRSTASDWGTSQWDGRHRSSEGSNEAHNTECNSIKSMLEGP